MSDPTPIPNPNVDMMTEVMNLVALRSGMDEAMRLALGSYVGAAASHYGLTDAQSHQAIKDIVDVMNAHANASADIREAAGE